MVNSVDTNIKRGVFRESYFYKLDMIITRFRHYYIQRKYFRLHYRVEITRDPVLMFSPKRLLNYFMRR